MFVVLIIFTIMTNSNQLVIPIPLPALGASSSHGKDDKPPIAVEAGVREFIINSPKYGNQTVYIDDSDWDLVKEFKWYPTVGTSKTFYARANGRTPEGKRYLIFMHNLLMGLTGIDHTDRNGLNNRRSNLRSASHAENTRNVGPRKDCTTGFKGVTFEKKTGKYLFQLQFNGKRVKGRCSTAVDAAVKYNELAKKHFGEFAYLNIIPDGRNQKD